MFSKKDTEEIRSALQAINAEVNSIVADMYKFTEEHPDWNTPSEDRTSPPDSISLKRCGRYPFCKNYITDKAWKRYGVCSPRCDYLADAEIDRIQQSD